MLIAWAYVRFGALPEVTGFLYGVKPVMIAIVVRALWRLALSAVKTKLLAGLAVLATVASAQGVHELVVLFGDDGFEKIVAEVAQLEQTLGIYDLAQFTPQL